MNKLPKVLIVEDKNDVSKTVMINRAELVKVETGPNFIEVRDSGELDEKGFYLSEAYTWQIVEDSDGVIVLVPTMSV